jgi:hypothetical protein
VKYKFTIIHMPMKNNLYPFLFTVLFVGHAHAQEVTAPAAAAARATSIPIFQTLSESTVQQRDGSSVTFRQVVPPVIAPQAVVAPAPTAAQEAAFSQMPVKECKVLSISASVRADGVAVLRWTSGAPQRLEAVSNVDFRYLTVLGRLETESVYYAIMLSAELADETLSDAEARAAQLLPVNGSASFALVGGSAAAAEQAEAQEQAMSPTERTEAIAGMEALLDYFDAHRDELITQYTQMEAANAARVLAARNAPLPPPRHAVIQFWPLQPAQRAALLEKALRAKGVRQP